MYYIRLSLTARSSIIVLTAKSKMLADSDMSITLSLCEVCPAQQVDEVAEVLMACFESRNKNMELLKQLIAREVDSTGKIMNF